jgi:hypothetical protein
MWVACVDTLERSGCYAPARAKEPVQTEMEAVATAVQAAPAEDERVAWANKMRLLVRTTSFPCASLALQTPGLKSGAA